MESELTVIVADAPEQGALSDLMQPSIGISMPFVEETAPVMLRVLVIDDNVHTRRVLRFGVDRLLEAKTLDGACVALDVREAEDGRQALHMMQDEHCDLVITDFYLPVMNGVELIRRIRARYARMPILAMSASGDDVRADLLDAGATAFLPKPLRSKDLVGTLKRLLSLV